jgi:hypothetical protein
MASMEPHTGGSKREATDVAERDASYEALVFFVDAGPSCLNSLTRMSNNLDNSFSLRFQQSCSLQIQCVLSYSAPMVSELHEYRA